MPARLLLPNLLTLGNLALGSWAIALSYQQKWELFAVALGGALVCDWLDGWTARLLRAESPLGKELDALADLTSFGLAPTFALFNYLKPLVPELPYDREVRFWMVMAPFWLPLWAAWRLARFNAMPEQSKRFFEGLPTPAQGLLWTLWLLTEPKGGWLHPAVWLTQIVAVGLLMGSRLPFLSLKSRKNLPWLGVLVGAVGGVWLWLPPQAWLASGVALYAGISYVAARTA
ncbi:MAG: CDP-alcohol phosphatidyltransferase family protein [Bacteroidia bacterium]|nr:CDP-alcohol phosphatidyltransferase family protein [Bacteroidia bacterium]MDW8057241.1 CDP-alcohol phosphatidyltransferase family protein [Bacteroidia bacterium]